MILIQCRSERSRLGSSPTKLVVVGVGVVQIIVVKVLLLAPNSPGSISETSEQKSTTNATDYTSDYSLS